MNKEESIEIIKAHLQKMEDGENPYSWDFVLALRFIVEKYGRPDIPIWLDIDDVNLSAMMYDEGRKLEAVKYLRSLVPDYVENPLRWSIDFLHKYMGIS